jgi:hypothetical protein
MLGKGNCTVVLHMASHFVSFFSGDVIRSTTTGTNRWFSKVSQTSRNTARGHGAQPADLCKRKKKPGQMPLDTYHIKQTRKFAVLTR